MIGEPEDVVALESAGVCVSVLGSSISIPFAVASFSCLGAFDPLASVPMVVLLRQCLGCWGGASGSLSPFLEVFHGDSHGDLRLLHVVFLLVSLHLLEELANFLQVLHGLALSSSVDSSGGLLDVSKHVLDRMEPFGESSSVPDELLGESCPSDIVN